MGRKPLKDQNLKKVNVSISMPKWMSIKLKENLNYSQIVVSLLEKYFNSKK